MISVFAENSGRLGGERNRASYAGFALIAFVVLLSIALVVPRGHATATVYTDKADYHPEEIVTIYGSGFIPNANMTISITRGDGSVDSCGPAGYSGSLNDTGFPRMDPCPFTSDSTGNFVKYYDLDGVTGAYSVVAWDGTNFASTAFTDAVSITVKGTDGNQHVIPSNEENLGQFGSTTIDKFITLKATGLGSGSTLNWNLVYVASAANNTILFPITTFIPASGSLTKSADSVSVEVKIVTSSLASGTYHGELQASGSGVSPTPSPGLYYFKFKVDTSPPIITSTVSPSPSANGWNKGNVTVTWSVSDPDSGIASSSGCGTATLTTETSGTSITCSATNGAGISNSVTVPVKIDKTSPTISGSVAPGPNSNGWNKGPVIVSFSCSDSLSGVASVTGSTILSGEGSGQSASGTCTDNAGNSATSTVNGINIDLTPPSLTGSRSPSGNSFDWNNGPVTVSFACSDTLSGVSSASSPTALSTEGSGQSVTGMCTDRAGNSASITVTGINIDLTPPSLTGSRSPSPNSNGWNNADVTVSFTCTDALSGVNSGPTTPQVVSAEGMGQSRSATCTDKAGNSASTSVSGISIDKTPPIVSGSKSPSPNLNDWNSAAVNVTFACSDSLSGVDVGPTSPQVVSTEGAVQSRTGACEDKAGNSASATVGDINIDLTPPTITGTRSVPPNGNGWNNVPVTVSFNCSDALSGTNSVSTPTTLGEGLGQSVTGTCTDKAGNSATTTVSPINIDFTSPSITGTRSPDSNANSWNNGPVVVSFTCSDTLSGVASATSPTTLSGEASGQSFTGFCTDNAGNTIFATVSGINIDLTPPTITGSRTPSANSFGWNNSPVTVNFACSDSLSGVASTADPVSLNSEGSGQSATGSCIDLAGNIASTSVGDINIDLTPPSLTGSQSPSPNPNGWNNADVTVSFTCTDGLAGVDAVSPDQIVSSEGAGQSRTGTCSDRAGNSASFTITGINIDKTPPSLTGSRTPGANADGWNNIDVTVSFTCTDAVSGVDTGPVTPQTISTEGIDQSRSARCTDTAGNSASLTVDGINIDTTSPIISGSRSPAPNLYDWTNQPVTVTFTCIDALSGVGTSPVSPQIVSVEGAGQSRTATCTDKAGNSVLATLDDINIDITAPTISSTRSAPPSANDWYGAPVTVSFSCYDTLSGVLSVSSSTTLGEGVSQTATGACVDLAGNTATVSENGINVDLTPPVIEGSRSPDPNAYGWNNSPVTVSFSCTDVLSGVDTVSSPSTLREGASQSVIGTCIDNAGNAATTMLDGINVDLTTPSITDSRSPDANTYGWNNVPVTVTFNCSDSLSGVASPSPSAILGEGASQSALGTCTDKAGNSASAVVSDINIDMTSPVVTSFRSVSPNSNGWNNILVTVGFSCSDALSGALSTSSPITLGEGAGQFATGSCVDLAGNSAAITETGINVDLTLPVIVGARSVDPNIYGWNDAPVTVSFSCYDALSGVGNSSSSTTLGEGTGQYVTGTCTDFAGNPASNTIGPISIDLTPPMITSSRTSANGFGWNHANVTVTFYCGDVLSGVDFFSGPTNISAEGAGQSVAGTCVDLAGNSMWATVGDINIDLTPPVTNGSRSPAPNSFGWNNGTVTVSFTCSDGLSGIDLSPSSTTLSGEGLAQSVTGICADKAGNLSSATVGNINIDETPPTITGSRSPAADANGWNNVDVTVSYSCTDALSGVDAITGSQVISTEGAGQSRSGTCVDKAGNSAAAIVTGISIDKTAPSISYARTPANIFGWNNSPVTVTFSCTDSLSGIDSVTGPQTVTGEDAGQSRIGSCADKAGNRVSVTDSDINIDLTAPSLSGTRTPAANANGWNNVDVITTFTCADALSGVAVPPVSPQTVSTEGAGQSRSATCFDRAGNSASASIMGINTDKTPPVLTWTRFPLANSFGWNNVSVTVSFECSDPLSGVAAYSAPSTVSTEGAGQSISGNCQDKAGNVATISVGSGINIDKTPPQTTITVGTPKYTSGSTVQVSLTTAFTLTGTDSLSRTYQTMYGIDDPTTTMTYTGPFNMPSKGSHTIYFRSTDKAFNMESVQSLSVVVGSTTITYTGSTQGVYSDPATVRAMLVEVASQQPISGKQVSFVLGAQSAMSTTNGTGVSTSIIVLNQASGSYTVTASFAGDSNFQFSTISTPFTILKESASISYTGDTVVSTGAKYIMLSSSVQEVQDGTLGDLTKAKVTFRIYASDNSQTLLQTIGPVPVVITSTPGVGTASIQITNMQENTYLVMVSLDLAANSFYSAPSTDPVVLTVYQPNGSYVTGGGWIVDSSGSHGNFGFVVRYNSAGNVQGHAVYVYRVGGLDYMIKSNAWIGMAIVGSHAYFQGKATLQVMDPTTGALLYSVGNYQFRVDVYDNTGTTVNGGVDTYQITVWDNNGIVYHQAAGSLMGGQIMVHDSKA